MSTEIDRERAAIGEDLASADEEIRRLAVERLSGLPARDAVPQLVERLGDESWRVRKAAVERLVGVGDTDRVVDALIIALADGDNPGRRNSAVEALMVCGSSVVPRLVDALETDDIDVRKLLVDALAGIGDVSARAAMIETLTDPDPNVRAAAADALGVVGGDAAAEALLARARAVDEDRLVQFSALRALARLEWSVPSTTLEALASDPVLRPAAFTLLGYCDDHGAHAQLLKGLASSSRASRDAAIEALLCRLARVDGAEADALAARIRETVADTEGLLETAVDRLREADLPGRLILVQFLGLVGSSDCVLPILESGRDEAIAEVALTTLQGLGDVTEEALCARWSAMDRPLRRAACELLAGTRGQVGNGCLREALDDDDVELRAAAARALGARGAGECLADLVRRLESAAVDEEPEAEEEIAALGSALVALAGAQDAVWVGRAVELLGARLGSASEPVRRASTSVLARIARPEDAEKMSVLLKDPSAQVRRLAVEGLGRLDPEVSAEPMRLAMADESPLVRMAAASAMGESDLPDVLPNLQRLLVDEDARVSAAAVRAIGNRCAGRGDADERARALELLASPLAGEGRGLVAVAALQALDAIGGADAARVAVGGLGSVEPEVVQAAVGCVGRHGDMDTLGDLIAVVQHPAWAVRGEAIQTLGERRVGKALPAILRRLETEQDSFVRDVIVGALRCLEG